MKNYRIEPHKIEQLVITTARAFEVMKDGKTGNPQDYPKYMHFMADLLKDLVETAYPIEKSPYIGVDLGKGNDYTGVIEVTKDNETGCVIVTETTPFNPELIETALENISKIAKSHKPPKAGEF